MVITIINHSIVFILILLFLLCTLEPVKRLQLNPKFRFLKVITKYHSIYAWLLLILSLIHGLLAEKTSASISGKMVWMILLLLIVFAFAWLVALLCLVIIYVIIHLLFNMAWST